MFIPWIGCIWNIWKSYHYHFTSNSKTQKSCWRISTESGLWLKWFAVIDISNFGDHFWWQISVDIKRETNLSPRSRRSHQYFLSSTSRPLHYREALEAFADLVYSLGLPMLATELFLQRHWIFGSVPCKLVSTVLLLNLYGSVYFLSTISLGELLIKNREWLSKCDLKYIFERLIRSSDRCYAVMAPISARKIRTNMYGWVISFISWLFALAFSAQGKFSSPEFNQCNFTTL